MLASLAASILTLSTAPSAAQLAEASKYSADHNGISFLVLFQDKVIGENYPNRGSANNASELASGTKSFTGIMALCAQQQGLLKLDERASETITEWKDGPKKDVTIRQLLSLTSGIPGGKGVMAGGRVPSYSEAIQLDSKFAPGTRFQYGPTPFMCFGEIMRRKLLPKKESVTEFMERTIFKPLGMSHGIWRKDTDGNPHMPSGAHFTAREWAKLGTMVIHDGKGVLKPGTIETLMHGTKANPSYGISWWLPSQGGVKPDGFRKWNWPSGLPQDVWVAAGAGGQRLYVIPSRDLVVVRQATIRLADTFDDGDFLVKLLLR